MSFFLHRAGRGRLSRIKVICAYGASSFDTFTTKEEVAGLLGSPVPQWALLANSHPNRDGYIYDITSNKVESSNLGGAARSAQKIVRSTHATSISTVSTNPSSLTLSDNESFAILIINSCSCSVTESNALAFGNSGVATFYIFPVPASSSRYVGSRTPTYVYQKCGEQLQSGALSVSIAGWGSSNSKLWGVDVNVVRESSATDNGLWSSLGNLYALNYPVQGTNDIYAILCWKGTDADTVKTNAVAIFESAKNCIQRLSLFTSSSSGVIVERNTDDYISRANSLSIVDDGIHISKAITNLFLYSNRMVENWTPSDLTLVNYASPSLSGLRVLSAVVETATTAEHKASLTVTPVATGVHWLTFVARMSAVDAIALVVDNGSVSASMSMDANGIETDYNGGPFGLATITSMGNSVFRVKLPIDLDSTDACTITLRILKDDGEGTYLDDYLGVVTRMFFAGHWSFVKSDVAGVIVPVSIGSASTAIAPIVDYSNAKAIERLRNGRLTASIDFAMDYWPEDDVCLWTWRKNSTNGVEVWLRYQGTSDNRRQFMPTINVITASAATETTLTCGSSWVLQNDSGSGTRVETIRLSVSINSAGVATWWARSEAGQEIEIYENPILTSGEDTIGSYVSHVPTSIRLGSAVDGTGQQAMTIKEVSVW